MNSYIIGRVEAGSDLLFRSSRRRGNVLETLPYIPGSAFRGALAARWLEQHGEEPDATFRRLFQSGDIRFGNARMAIGDDESFVVPLTLHTDKHQPFAAGSSTVDLLVGDPPASSGVLERVRGEMTADGRVRTGGVGTVTRTRIGTFRPQAEDDLSEPARAEGAQDGLAADEQLFTEVRLAAGTAFRTRIEGPAEALQQLMAILPSDEDVLAIGRSRTVMGHAVVSWTGPAPTAHPAPQLGTTHTLTALSDLVLLDRFQRSVTTLDRDALALVLACQPSDIEVLPGGRSRTVHVGGWDGVNQLPTHIDLAIRAGSAVRFTAPDAAVARLAADPWVGWRRAEGHGRVAIDWAGHRPGTYELVDPATPDIPATQLDDQLAAAAKVITDELDRAMNEQLTPTLWSQVEDAVRRGQQLQPPEEQPAGWQSQHAQAVSGRGGARGRVRRDDRTTIVNVVNTAFTGGNGAQGPALPALDQDQRVQLVEHIGREVRLRELERREAQRRRHELGVQHHGQGGDV